MVEPKNISWNGTISAHAPQSRDRELISTPATVRSSPFPRHQARRPVCCERIR